MLRFVLVIVAFLTAIPGVSAAPAANLWPRWEAHNPSSTATVDHGVWGAFLKAYLSTGSDGVNRLAYRQVSAADKQALAAYLDRLSKVPVSQLSRPEQLAYWINLYNALTVKLILDKYPVVTIVDINISGWFSIGPWGAKLTTVEGEKIALDDIEHRILRPIWKDPRIHYAVNCASIGCPNLMPEPFTAQNAEALLTAGAKGYVNHPRGVRVEGTKVTLSRIYDWFQSDFGGNESGVLQHIAQYAEPGLADRLRNVRSLAGYEYDWSLNEAR